MSVSCEMKAFEQAVNISLLNDIVFFIENTAEATWAKRRALQNRCIFLDTAGDAAEFQEKYGFLYLGELLERYDERFGMSLPDLRAIALALGYAKDMLSDEMFVGTQRTVFLQKIKGQASGDTYLTGALYLMNEGQSGAVVLRDQLEQAQYDTLEELIFVLSLFQKSLEQAFLRFKPQLLSLLGSGRTTPVLGNMGCLNWLITRLQPIAKAAKAKDMALIRALCALPVSFVKAGSRQHDLLLAHNWTPLEIAYANIMVIQCQTAKDVLQPYSIVTEKIVVSLFREILNSGESFAPEVYKQLTELYVRYKEFKIKLCGENMLAKILYDDVCIQNADTFVWFHNLIQGSHPAFAGFDIMDPMWDSLAANMSTHKYRELFESRLNEEMTPTDIQNRIDRYDLLTGQDYVAGYSEHSSGAHFSLLVKKGIIDLWQSFQFSIGEDGTIIKPKMLERIRDYIDGIRTLPAFRFYEKFLPKYGFEGVESYFSKVSWHTLVFSSGLMEYSSYNGNISAQLKIHRDFLNAEEQGKLFCWLEEYIFLYKTDTYLPFALAVLLDKSTAALLQPPEQRRLFDQIIKWPALSASYIERLNQRYLTAEELQKAEDNRQALKQERERRSKDAMLQKVQSTYQNKVDGTFTSLHKFIPSYAWSDEQKLTCKIAKENLPQMLEKVSYKLSAEEASQFLGVCAQLCDSGFMRFAEAQNYISRIKEVAANDAGNVETER